MLSYRFAFSFACHLKLALDVWEWVNNIFIKLLSFKPILRKKPSEMVPEFQNYPSYEYMYSII